MLVFAASDKGGTGRSVTSCNIAYRLSVSGHNVAYLDFDFGSPTAGALFEIPSLVRGVSGNKELHSYLLGETSVCDGVDIRKATGREQLKKPDGRAGRQADPVSRRPGWRGIPPDR